VHRRWIAFLALSLAGSASAQQAADPQIEGVRFGFDVRIGILSIHRANPPDLKKAQATCDAAKARAAKLTLTEGQRGQLELCFAGLARQNDKAAACRGYTRAVQLLEKDPKLTVDLGIARENRAQLGC
jgi:hypothetical protein